MIYCPHGERSSFVLFRGKHFSLCFYVQNGGRIDVDFCLDILKVIHAHELEKNVKQHKRPAREKTVTLHAGDLLAYLLLSTLYLYGTNRLPWRLACRWVEPTGGIGRAKSQGVFFLPARWPQTGWLSQLQTRVLSRVLSRCDLCPPGMVPTPFPRSIEMVTALGLHFVICPTLPTPV